MSDSKSNSLSNLNRGGRPPGSKNKTTLVKEALQGEWDDLLKREGKKVFQAVVDAAMDGNMNAAKLILDRIIPVQEDKLKGKVQIGEGGLHIHIEKLEATPAPKPMIEGEVEDAVFEEVPSGS